jgi:archaemetzincin
MILTCLVFGAMSVQAAPPPVNLVPCGEVPSGLLAYLQDGIAKALQTEVTRVGNVVPLPAGAYDPRRRQYRAEAFLPVLGNYRPGRDGLVLGVAGVDLFVPELNFVFGLAEPRQRCAIISLARLHPEFYGQPANPQLLRERALKEAIHELGHLLGLGHCPNPACVMFFSNSLADTDRKGPGFCPRCRSLLEK